MHRSCALLFLAAALPAQDQLRPPAVPLIVHDPYFSIWSDADNLTGQSTKHWTGTDQSLGGMIRIDGTVYRVIGAEKPQRDAGAAPPMRQTKCEVLPTHTIYQFESAGVVLTLSFITPALAEDLDVLSRPVTYLEWRVRSSDGRQHAVSLYLDASAQFVVNNVDEQGVTWGRFHAGNLEALRMGSQQQPILEKDGDNLRIDWGYLYLAAPSSSVTASVMTDRTSARLAFMKDGKLPASDDLGPRKPMRFRMPVLAFM